MVEKLPVTLVSCRRIVRDTYEATFEFDQNLFSFDAGQYVRVTLPHLEYKDPKGASRDFSIASSPNIKGTFSVAFRNTGSGFKKTLIHAKSGMTVEITGPQEIVSLKKIEGKSMVFIAGGIGITPFLSIIRFATEQKLPQKIVLLYGNSDKARAAYLEELKKIERENPNFEMGVFYSHITQELIRKNVKDIKHKCFCLAGPSIMTKSVVKELEDMGVSDSKICIEEFSGYEEKATVSRDALKIKGEARLNALLSALDKSAIVSTTDVKGNITYVNRLFEEISKYSEKELVGQNHRILKSGYHSEEFYKKIWDTIVSGKVWHGQIKNKAKDGSFYWVESSIAPTFDEKREIMGYVAIRFPITESKKLEEELAESERRLGFNVQNMPMGMIEWNNDFQVANWNPAAEKIFGYTKEEVLGKHANIILSEEVRPLVDKIWHQLLSGSLAQSTNENITKDGRTIICEWHNAPLSSLDGKVYGAVSMVMDITKRKEIEVKLVEREKLLNDAQRITDLGVYETDFTKNHWESSEILDEIFGIDKNFVRNVEGWSSIIHPDDREMMTDYLTNEVFGKHLNFDKEYRIIQKNSGRQRWVHGLGDMTFDKNSKPLTMVGTIQDITKRKETEENLSLQATALQASADAIVITDTKGIIQRINNAFTTLTGYTAKEAIGQNMSIVKSGNYDKSYYKKFWTKLLAGETIRKEIVNRRKDGTLYDEDEMITPVKDNNGKITHFISIKRDITKRKIAENVAKESQLMLQNIVDLLPVRVFWKDKNLNYLGSNKAFAKDAGWKSPADLPGKDDFAMVWKEHANLYREDDMKVIKSGISKLDYEEPLTTPTGQEIWINTNKVPLEDKEGKITGVLGTYIDITQRKRAEEALFDSEERFRLSSKAINNIIWDLDLIKSTILWSEGINTLFGYKIENLKTPYKWWVDNIHPEDRSRIQKSIMGVIEGNKDYWKDEYRFLTGGKSYASVEDHGYVLRDKKGKAYRMIGAMNDLTEKRLEEEKIKTNEQRFSNLLENSQDVIIISDPHGVVSYVSPGVKHVLGFTPEEYRGIVLKQVHPDDLPIVSDAVKKVMDPNTKEPVTSIFRVKNKKGEWRWIESVAMYEDDEIISGIVSNCHDITELKNNEKSAQARAEELARFNALMVGRELKMIELKKTIKELELKLKDVKK